MVNKRKWQVFFLLLLIAFLVLNNQYNLIEKGLGKTNQNNASLPLNTSRKGVAIFYDTLKRLGYSVKIDAEAFIEKSDANIYIITENSELSGFTMDKEEEWINKGGKLIYLTSQYKDYQYPHILEKHQDSAALYALGKGKLLIGDINLITNDTLLKNKDGAYFVLKSIDSFGGDIYFNEYYRFSQGQPPSLYRNIPLHIKIILWQVLLAVLGLLIYLGQRFGKAKRIVEEIEREENEYLYAAANLYATGQCLDSIYAAFYKKFTTEFQKTFKRAIPPNWLDLWTAYKLPGKEEAVGVFNQQKNNRQPDLKIIKDLDRLTQILIKRREEAWEKLRQKNL